MVIAYKNLSWFRQNNDKVIQGRQDWYSVLSWTFLISAARDIEDIAAVVEQDCLAPTPSHTAVSPTPVMPFP